MHESHLTIDRFIREYFLPARDRTTYVTQQRFRRLGDLLKKAVNRENVWLWEISDELVDLLSTYLRHCGSSEYVVRRHRQRLRAVGRYALENGFQIGRLSHMEVCEANRGTLEAIRRNVALYREENAERYAKPAPGKHELKIGDVYELLKLLHLVAEYGHVSVAVDATVRVEVQPEKDQAAAAAD